MTGPSRDRNVRPTGRIEPLAGLAGSTQMPTVGPRSDGAATKGAPTGPGKPLKSDNLRRPDPDAGRLPASARNVLSREEIEALLNPDLDDLPLPRKGAGAVTVGEATQPAVGPLETGLPGALAAACDALIARWSFQLGGREQIGASLRLAATERRPFRGGVDAAPGNGVFVCLASGDGTVGAVLVLPCDAASAIVERTAGASTVQSVAAAPRALTDLDQALLIEGLGSLSILLPALGEARVYADRSIAASAAPDQTAVRLSVTLRLASRAWPVLLFVDEARLPGPGMELEQAIGTAASDDGASSRHGADDGPPSGPDLLSTVITARMATLSVPMSRLSGLKPGATLKLGIPADTPVTLHSGETAGPVIGEAALGREGGHMAVRLIRKRRAFS